MFSTFLINPALADSLKRDALVFAIGCGLLTIPAAAKEPTKKAWLGVHIQELTPSLHQAMKLGDKTGLLITHVVEDSPADNAGLREEDVIIEFAGQAVERADAFTKLVRNSEPGKEIKIVVMRDGARKEITVTLGTLKKPKAFSHGWRWGGGPLRFFAGQPRLGVQAHELDEDLASYFQVKADGGALVLKVMEDTPADKAGLKAGDVITKIDDESIDDPDDLIRALADYDEDDEITVTYIRHGKSATARVTLEDDRGRGFYFFQAPGKGTRHIELRGPCGPLAGQAVLGFFGDDEPELFAPRVQDELRAAQRAIIETRERIERERHAIDRAILEARDHMRPLPPPPPPAPVADRAII